MKIYRLFPIYLLSLGFISCVNISIKDNNITSKIDTDVKSNIKVDTKIQDSLKVDSEVNLSQKVNINTPKINPTLLPVQSSIPSNSPKPSISPKPILPAVNPTHPPPPDPQQPTTEDDFWKLMARFGFMQTRTKDELLIDIKKSVSMEIKDWSTGQVDDKSKNISEMFSSNKKYFNPALKSEEDYLQKSLYIANDNPKNVDFYLDVEYGAKDGKGVIIMQRINPITLEVLYYNSKGFITNYTQTSKPKTGGSPPLLRLTHFMFIPTSVYN